ncbi:hypothetical protein ACHAW5_006967 [Stephanodiscus triporus]|uniref:Uncharacterized protein n=1 Tax=Stephanodiscus triporus TaxID=2934178 RepID=A0ABD3QBF2_9STRA
MSIRIVLPCLYLYFFSALDDVSVDAFPPLVTSLSNPNARCRTAYNSHANKSNIPHKYETGDVSSVIHGNLSRRRWASSISSVALSGAVLLSRQGVARAAPPLTADVADGISARAERALRPRPARVLRPRMNLDFAILLMRASYNAVDDIDVVPMDQFQRDFFLVRQAEYKTYADSLGPGAMRQGDLADPNYFDFISFAQYSAISREIVDPQSVFEEKRPVDVGDDEPQRFDTVVVRRDPSLSKGDLSQRHSRLVGGAILDKLIERFGDTASAIPTIEPGSRPGATALLAAIKQMVNLFVISGFAWDGDASMLRQPVNGDEGAAGAQFAITFTSPATLWSGQSLKAKNAVLMNDFALKTANEIMSRAGYRIINSSVKYERYREISTFTLM